MLGVPVLATTCPAFEECVSEEEIILVPNTQEALYDGVHRILQDASLEREYKLKIRKDRTQESLFMNRLREIERLWRESE